MHMCEWRHLKHPDSNIICTREFIPTLYELALFHQSGNVYRFDALGQFKSPGFVWKILKTRTEWLEKRVDKKLFNLRVWEFADAKPCYERYRYMVFIDTIKTSSCEAKFMLP